LGRWIGEGQRDNAARIRRGAVRIGAGMNARLAPPLEAVHQAVGCSLTGSRFRFNKWIGIADADRAKSEGFRERFDLVAEGHLALD
jgi:hypothetical protein